MRIQDGGLTGNQLSVSKLFLAIIATMSRISDWQSPFSRTFPISGDVLGYDLICKYGFSNKMLSSRCQVSL